MGFGERGSPVCGRVQMETATEAVGRLGEHFSRTIHFMLQISLDTSLHQTTAQFLSDKSTRNMPPDCASSIFPSRILCLHMDRHVTRPHTIRRHHGHDIERVRADVLDMTKTGDFVPLEHKSA